MSGDAIRMSGDDPGDLTDDEGGLATAKRPEIRTPRMFRVLLHNDDYSTMEFVVQVLMMVFNKGETEAVQIMLSVHTKGQGICGVFTREIAETKVAQVVEFAKENQMPLKCTMEPE